MSKVSHYITLLHNAIGPRNSRHLRNQSDSNLTPIAPWLLEFSRALSGLLVAILSLVVMFSSALITLLFISRPLIEMLSKVLNLLPRDIQSKRCLQLITDLTAIPIKEWLIIPTSEKAAYAGFRYTPFDCILLKGCLPTRSSISRRFWSINDNKFSPALPVRPQIFNWFHYRNRCSSLGAGEKMSQELRSGNVGFVRKVTRSAPKKRVERLEAKWLKRELVVFILANSPMLDELIGDDLAMRRNL